MALGQVSRGTVSRPRAALGVHLERRRLSPRPTVRDRCGAAAAPWHKDDFTRLPQGRRVKGSQNGANQPNRRRRDFFHGRSVRITRPVHLLMTVAAEPGTTQPAALVVPAYHQASIWRTQVLGMLVLLPLAERRFHSVRSDRRVVYSVDVD